VLDEVTRRPFEADWYRKVFREVRAAAVLSCASLADFRDQDLRDTAVTWLALAECNKFEIAAITGHSLKSIDTILAHYLGLHPELARSAIGKLVTYLEARA
jgi:RNA 3'-terminal phosphate cyclase